MMLGRPYDDPNEPTKAAHIPMINIIKNKTNLVLRKEKALPVIRLKNGERGCF